MLVLLTFKGGGGGANFFRAFINSELGLPEVAPCMARTFGGVFGHRRPNSELIKALKKVCPPPPLKRYIFPLKIVHMTF